ncbi:MAG: hypothetical protein EZS28_025335 [Streblomastix strix]|uniref:Uncharacterized protein n=1 Tax=Streblomastix strix TaxID=222440 RepID=A0A5J4V9B2_9EUKA|nr:MAG: hypothetical protein EZS28_025335 [Streblomastix strix]
MSHSIHDEHLQILYTTLMLAIQSPIRESCEAGIASMIQLITTNDKFRHYIIQVDRFLLNSIDILQSETLLQFSTYTNRIAYAPHTKLAVMDILNQLTKIKDVHFDSDEVIELKKVLQKYQIYKNEHIPNSDDIFALKERSDKLLESMNLKINQQKVENKIKVDEVKLAEIKLQAEYDTAIRKKRLHLIIFIIAVFVIIASVCALGYYYYIKMNSMKVEIQTYSQDIIKAEQDLKDALQTLELEKNKVIIKQKSMMRRFFRFIFGIKN